MAKRDQFPFSNECRYDWLIYVFDAALMAIVLIISYFWYIGNALKQPVARHGENFEMIHDEP